MRRLHLVSRLDKGLPADDTGESRRHNQHRPHGLCRTPWQVWYELCSLTPCHDEVDAKYEISAERLWHPVDLNQLGVGASI